MQEPEDDVPENKALRYLGVAFVSVLLATLVLKGLDLMATRGGSRGPRPPKLPEHSFVLRPEFESATGKVKGGAAFAVRVDGDSRKLLLTALHLVESAGPVAGLKKIYFRDAFASEGAIPNGTADAVLAIPGTAIHSTPSTVGDVAAIWAGEDCFFPTVSLAAHNPAPGEYIWLVCPILKGAPEKQKLHRAKVDSVADGDLVYWFDNPSLDITATNGAPLINQAGEVVGINLGGAPEKGKMSGFGNPVERFRTALKEAVVATPDKSALKSDPVKRPKPPAPPPK